MLVMLNYAVDPALLTHLVPRGTQSDQFGGKTYISLVGFRFTRTRVRSLWIPFHSDFDEVNLRFYVRHVHEGEARRGVVFVREVVPRWAIAAVARGVYHEKYVALPMRHRIAGPVSEGGRLQVEYAWRIGPDWATIAVECEGKPAPTAEGSIEQFIAEHYWGYAAQPDGGTVEYRVEHQPWRVWHAAKARFTGDCWALYGTDLAACLTREPDSAFVADGSAVAVWPGQRIELF